MLQFLHTSSHHQWHFLRTTIPAATLNDRLLVQAAGCYKCATVHLKTVQYTVCEADSPSGHEVAECHAPWVTGPAPCQPARAAAHEDSGCLATELVEAISAQVLSASPMATVAVGVWESVSMVTSNNQ